MIEQFIPNVKIEFHNNDNYATYHFRDRLCSREFYYSSEISTKIQYKNLENLTKAITNRLLKINGIKQIRISQYKISIEKAPCFSWEEFENEFKLIFSTYLPVER